MTLLIEAFLWGASIAGAVEVAIYVTNQLRKPCGHRNGPWVCVKTGCDGRGHYYVKAPA